MKKIVDAAMTVLLMCLMAYQVTGEAAHEWIGMGMTLTVIVHQILNRKWYGAGHLYDGGSDHRYSAAAPDNLKKPVDRRRKLKYLL